VIWAHAPAAAAAFSAAVLVPLAARVLDEPDRHGRRAGTVATARSLALPAGGLAAASFLLPADPAFLLCAPYVVVALLLACHGLTRVLRGGPVSELGIGAGALYLGGAAVWLCAHRAGYALLGYPPYWVALTATHFHVAGLALPLAAGHLARRGGPLASLTVLVVITAIPLTALGIGFFPRLEPVAALLLATGGLLVALRYVAHFRHYSSGKVPRTLAAAALLGSMPLAATYALRAGWRLGTLDELTTMAVTHGALNLVFGVAALVALVIERPAAGWRRGVPLSRITARGRVGGDFFERIGAPQDRACRGTCDRLEELASAAYDPAATAPEIRRFYEGLAGYRIQVSPRWRWGFRTGARIWRAIALRMGQLALPVDAGEIRSRIVALDAARDGRPAPRAWIREDAGGRAMFVSAYATHRHDGTGYMNVAFPLPGAQMTSINRFLPLPGGGVHVTSRGDGPGSDCGCWLVIRGVAIRLPFTEDVRLWTPGMLGLPADLRVPADAAVVGRQHMSLLGLRFLTIDYAIARQPDEARVDVAGDPAPPEA
jgi:hypothetical protein